AEDLLAVSVMIRDRGILPGEKEYSDGIVTSWNTFQKYYTQKSFKEYLQENLKAEIHSAGIGIFYIFKNSDWVEKYLNARMQKRPASVSVQIRQEEHSRILADWLDLYQELGRIPVQAEFKEYKYVLKYFGSMENAAESMRAEIDQDTFFENSRRRKEKLNVALCRHFIRKNGAPKWKDLRTEEQTDIKIYYSDFNEALNFAMSELKTLSDLSTVSRYISESSVGKVLPDDIYIHSDSLRYAPEMLQILVELAKIILPPDFEYNIIKIARNSWHVTFLNYPEFYNDPHPALKDSIKVFLHKNQIGYRDYSSSENPPILHRKETFLHSSHPKYEEYSALTGAEESAGLLSRRDIGTRKGWEKVLKEKGL
ncbi:MAG TPA: DNA phosphorothioation-associated putative methyltransferase, partial [Leptospiraceae bacterium]|nr:DNA phosphorothioation-associated putative methyltransferase [Leptospiraceae bacterium]